MEKEVLKELIKIELEHNVKILYCTYSGSKLYGTDSPLSDTDYKFIFVPSQEDVLLKKDPMHIQVSAQTKNKNTCNDVDFDGSSIYKFFRELSNSDTGSIDILFSMYREDTIIYQDSSFVDMMKENRNFFLNKNMKSFTGYALGQAKKFGIKGARYDELKGFIDYYGNIPYENDTKLSLFFDRFKEYIERNQLKYIKFIEAPGPRSNGNQEDITYISVLGKMFEGNVNLGYFIDRISSLKNQFGNRTKTISETDSKADFKALSHAYRISSEVIELIQTEFIEFPLREAEYIRSIKEGKVEVEEVINQVQEMLDRVDELLIKSSIPEKSNQKEIDKMILDLIKGFLIF